MITLKTIEIDNFLCFGPSVKVNLYKRGLVCIIGQNEDSGAAESNGAGKSGLLESIYFCCYGKMLRKILMDKIVRKKNKGGCSVKLTFEDSNNRCFMIRRYRNDKEFGDSLYLEQLLEDKVICFNGQDKDDTQKIIENIIGISPSLFRQIVLFGQGGLPRFSELSDSQKKELLEEILGLSVYEQSSKLAKSKLSMFLEKKIKTKHDLEGVQQHLLTSRKRFEEFNIAKAKWKKNKDDELSFLDKEIQKLENVKSDLSSVDFGSILKQKEEFKTKLSEIKQKKTEIKDKEKRINNGYQEKRDELFSKITKYNVQSDNLDKEYKRIDLLIFNGICPNCKQSTEFLDKNELAEIENNMVAIRKQQITVEKKMHELELAKKKIDEQMNKDKESLAEEEEDIQNKISILQKNIILLTQKQESLSSLDSLKDRYNSIKDTIYNENPLENDVINEMVVLEEKEKTLSNNVEEYSQTAEKYRVLVDVFKLIRSFVFESFSSSLNNSLKRYCYIQNKGELVAEIQATSETSKSEIREKISIMVKNASGGDSYNSCSVGEQRRLDLPIAFALQDFSAKRGLGMGVCLLDEMFEGVDSKGKQGVFDVLSILSRREHTPSVFVITHSESLVPMFSSFIKVVKRNGFSSIEEY